MRGGKGKGREKEGGGEGQGQGRVEEGTRSARAEAMEASSYTLTPSLRWMSSGTKRVHSLRLMGLSMSNRPIVRKASIRSQ